MCLLVDVREQRDTMATRHQNLPDAHAERLDRFLSLELWTEQVPVLHEQNMRPGHKKIPATHARKKGTSTLVLLPGIHKITIPARLEGRKVKNFDDKIFYAALHWRCYYPLSTSGSNPAKTVILLQSESKVVKKTGLEDLRDTDPEVPLYFFSHQRVSFKRITLRSAIPYATYALLLFDAKNVIFNSCNFPDLNDLEGGIAIAQPAQESKETYPSVRISKCKFIVSYTSAS